MEIPRDSSTVTSLEVESKIESAVNSRNTQPTVRNERKEKGKSKYLSLNMNAYNETFNEYCPDVVPLKDSYLNLFFDRLST